MDPDTFERVAELTFDGTYEAYLPPKRYWLGLEAEGFRARVDTTFKAGQTFVLEADPEAQESNERLDLPIPAGKPLHHDDPLLGDVTGNGVINISDVIALLRYMLSPTTSSLAHPFLGDINRDGDIDWTDIVLLGNYVKSGTNEHGIGTVVQITLWAKLVPDPTETVFQTNGEWVTFRVETTADSLLVKVNSPGTDVILEIAGGGRSPSRNYCGPEADDSPSRARRNAWRLHLAGCEAGSTHIVLMDHTSRDTLKTYPITIREQSSEAPMASDRLNIEIIFVEAVGDSESVLKAADLWADRIEKTDPIYAKFDTRNGFYFNWAERTQMPNIKIDQVVAGFLLLVGLNESRLGYGYPLVSWYNENRQIIQPDVRPRVGYVSLPSRAYYEGSQESARVELAAHEIGHALGIAHDLWYPELKKRSERWYHIGANTREAYRAMGASNTQYIQGVPLADDKNHWYSGPFDGALMGNTVYEGAPITAVTLGALADRGWATRMELAQPFDPFVSSKVLQLGSLDCGGRPSIP